MFRIIIYSSLNFKTCCIRIRNYYCILPQNYEILKRNSNRNICGLSSLFSTSSIVQNRIFINGLNLHWEKFGNGPHIVLCLPGLFGSIAQHFHPVAKEMNLNKFTLIALDPPGYGKSRPPDRQFPYKTKEIPLSDDAMLAGEFMKELGYHRYSILGFSNGAITGAIIAAAQPDVVQKLVMCSAPYGYNDHTVKAMEGMADLKKWPKSTKDALLQDYEEDYAQKMIKDALKMLQELAKDDHCTKLYESVLQRLRVPTLFIKGKKDWYIRTEDVLAYKQHIKNLKFVTTQKGRHNHTEFLDEFVSLSENFLSKS